VPTIIKNHFACSDCRRGGVRCAVNWVLNGRFFGEGIIA